MSGLNMEARTRATSQNETHRLRTETEMSTEAETGRSWTGTPSSTPTHTRTTRANSAQALPCIHGATNGFHRIVRDRAPDRPAPYGWIGGGGARRRSAG